MSLSMTLSDLEMRCPRGPIFPAELRPYVRTSDGKNIKPRFLQREILGFQVFFKFLTYKCRTQNYDPQAKIRPCKWATDRNSYLNIICIKLN